MNRISLAVKYLMRRKSRTLLILIVFLTINIMAFTILSIRQAANDALTNLEQKPPDHFYLESQYEADPKTVVTEGSAISYMSVPYLITHDVIEKIMNIDGIKIYAVHYATSSGIITDKNGSPLELVHYNIPVSEDDVSSVRGISDSSLFLSSRINLKAGKHITPDSKREAMVTLPFAVLNHLNPGDHLLITTPGNPSGIRIALSGIYEFTDKTDETDLSPSEISANVIYVDPDTALALDNGTKGIISAAFFVEQPDQLASIFAQVQKLDIDWNKYELYKETDAYVIDTNSVKAVSKQVSVLTAVIIVTGFLVVTLVLMLQTKMRTNEMAVLLSLGFTKNSIRLQHMIEAMIPAGISIAAAYFIGRCLLSGALFHAFNIPAEDISIVTLAEILVLNLSLLTVSIWISGARILNAPPNTVFEKNN